MKTAIMFLLSIALCAAAFFTRPSEADFKQYIINQKTQGDSNVLKQGLDEYRAEAFLKQCTFNNRVLWTDVQQDGKTVYTGAFSHWFNRGTIKTEVQSLETKFEKMKQAAQS